MKNFRISSIYYLQCYRASPHIDIFFAARAACAGDEGRRTPPLSRGGYPQCYAQYAQNTPTPSRQSMLDTTPCTLVEIQKHARGPTQIGVSSEN